MYEDGVLIPAKPFPLKEHEKVRVSVETRLTWAELTAGMMGWKGSGEEAEYFAKSSEPDFPKPEDEAPDDDPRRRGRATIEFGWHRALVKAPAGGSTAALMRDEPAGCSRGSAGSGRSGRSR